MDLFGATITAGLIITLAAVAAAYAFWLKNRHKHPSKTTTD
jgi:hypothetical protein